MKEKPKKITSWSNSRLSVYQLCPRKAKYLFIDKLKEPGSPAMERGSYIHGLAENYLNGIIKELPPELEKLKSSFVSYRKDIIDEATPTFVEDSWSFKKDWSETRWDDWAECWLRVKVDYAVIDIHDDEGTTLFVFDWKTGKYRPEAMEEYQQQLELYALAGLKKFPNIDAVMGFLEYLDTGDEVQSPVVRRADLPKLEKKWAKLVKPMLSDVKFPPRPNDKCRWCHFRKSNGGPCEY